LPALSASRTSIHVISSSQTVLGAAIGLGVSTQLYAFWAQRPDLENYLRHVLARQEHQTAERLGELRMPTLVLFGDRDTKIMGTGSHVEQSEYLLAHLPNATKRVVDGAAHGMFWERPERTAEILLEWTDTH